MLQLHAPPEPPRMLVDVALDPAEEVEHKGLVDRGAVETVRGKRNRVQLGVDDAVAVLEGWPTGTPLEPQIKAQLEQWDFTCVRLACSFVPDRGCRFVWVRVLAQLTASPPADAGAPVAFDLFPRAVDEKRTLARTYSLTPKLSLAFAEVGAGATDKQETIRYEPRLAVAGLLTDAPTWDFHGLDRSGLVGSRELFMVLKAPKGAGVEAGFTLSAEVETRFRRVPLRRYREPKLAPQRYLLVL